MIRRSGPTTCISIVAADCRGWDGAMYKNLDAVVPPVMDRVERLELWGYFGELGHAYDQLMSTPAPALKYLRLAKTAGRSLDVEIAFDGLFAGHAPLLSTLRLYGVGFPATSFYVFGNLKHLDVWSEDNDNDEHTSPAELVEALAHMPLLEVLSMTGCVLSDWTDDGATLLPSQQFVPVNLHNLRTLTIEGDRHVLDYMRRYIMLPVPCVVSEKYHDDE